MRLFTIVLAMVFNLALSPAWTADLPEVRSLAPGGTSPSASIDALSWLAGRWVGEGLGGAAEEVIAPASGGQMMGMFRHSKPDGAPNFYEFYLFVEHEGSLLLKLKHFTPGMTGWEEKDGYVEFPLVAIDGKTAYFDGITYALSGPDELTVVVNVSEVGEIPFKYERQLLH